MDNIYWETEQSHSDNSATMQDYLENINMLDIHLVQGTYAEGSNGKGERYAIHASGDGDFNHHKIEFILID
jgi:hypothetical protein|tara:strand:+ start:52 stop:264 length:213 start_codon:yes stop_codon:yes gene_type:complete